MNSYINIHRINNFQFLWIYLILCILVILSFPDQLPHTIHWLLQSATKQLLYSNELIAWQLQAQVLSYDPLSSWTIQYFSVHKCNWKGKGNAQLWIIQELNFVANWSLQVHNSAYSVIIYPNLKLCIWNWICQSCNWYSMNRVQSVPKEHFLLTALLTACFQC